MPLDQRLTQVRTSVLPLFRIAVVPAALAAAFAAHAQQAPIQQVEVRASADAYDPRRDDTASKIVVKREEIMKYGDTNLLDVLKRIPGLTVTGTPGRGGEVRMRGLGSGYTQILLDGERAPSGFSIDTLAPSAIERIEVLRAASAEYSTESIAGTINIVLKKTPRKGERKIAFGYARGPDTHSPNANLQMADRWDRFSYSVAADVMRNNFNGGVASSEEERSLSGQRTALRTMAAHEDGSFRSFNLVPRLNWILDGGDTLSSESALNINRMGIQVHAPTTTVFGAMPPYPEFEIGMTGHRAFLRTSVDWAHKLADGAKLDIKLGATAGHESDTTYRDDRGNPDVEEMTRTIDSASANRGMSSTGKYTVPLWEGHAVALGWDGRYDKREEQRRERDYLHPSLEVPDGFEDSTANVARAAIYGQDEWNLTAHWSLYLGARWEGVRINANGNTFGTARSKSGVFSPLMQTLYQLPGTKDDHLRLAVTRTYKAPGLQQLVSHLISIHNSQEEPDVLPNPNLKPELALGVDAAYEHFWGEGGMFSVSASSRQIDDYTRYLVAFDGGRWISSPANIGKAQTRSLEVEAKLPLKSMFAAAPAMEVHAAVSRNWSKVDAVPGPDNRLDQQTPLSANLGIDYTVGAVSTGGSFAFKNGGNVRVAANQVAYANVQRNLDLYALWKLGRQYQLRLTAENVLGQDIVRESSYTSATGIVRNRLVNLMHPALRATLGANF
jgi:outer membrane receptor protein involved in Fe transport